MARGRRASHFPGVIEGQAGDGGGGTAGKHADLVNVGIGGHFAPVMCSFRASPVPTPKVNLLSVSRLAVAAACAMIAG